MTQIVDTTLLLDSHKWIFVFLFSDGAWRSMSRKHHQVIFKRIQLLTDRFLDLLIASTLKVSPSYTTIEEGIDGEYTIGATHQADTTASMARSMQHFQCECTKGDRVAFIEQNIRLALDKRCWTIEHLRRILIGIHVDIIRVDCQRHRIDGADRIDGTDVVNMPMRVDDIFGNKLILLYIRYDALRLVARVDNDCFKCLRTGIQVTVLLKHADSHTYDSRQLLFVLFGHALLFLGDERLVILLKIIKHFPLIKPLLCSLL